MAAEKLEFNKVASESSNDVPGKEHKGTRPAVLYCRIFWPIKYVGRGRTRNRWRNDAIENRFHPRNDRCSFHIYRESDADFSMDFTTCIVSWNFRDSSRIRLWTSQIQCGSLFCRFIDFSTPTSMFFCSSYMMILMAIQNSLQSTQITTKPSVFIFAYYVRFIYLNFP